MKILSVELIDSAVDSVNPTWWKQLMSLFLQPGRSFEIRCWREEPESVERASAFGTRSEEDCTGFEASFKGTLTGPVIDGILNAGKPQEAYRMTEFFTISVENKVSCEHYGRELYLFDPPEDVCRQLAVILEPIRQYFVLGESDT